MGLDYYNILKVHRNAAVDDIRKSYLRLARMWHPDKNLHSGRAEAEAKFKQITEAYEVLSDSNKREIYDQHGEEGLKGMPAPGSQSRPSTSNGSGGPSNFRFNPRNADDVFAEFVSDSRPYPSESSGRAEYTQFQPRRDGTFGQFNRTYTTSRPPYEDGASKSQLEKPPAMEWRVSCSLEELYNGSTKKLRISRDVAQPNGSLVKENEILTIDVKPGWKTGTKITFEDKGNRLQGKLPQDLVMVIDEKPHEVYTREGNDLLVHQKINLVDALAGTMIHLRKLDGHYLPIKLTNVVTPGYELVFENEGWPIRREQGKKGSLAIKFDVIFPTMLAPYQRVAIREILGG